MIEQTTRYGFGTTVALDFTATVVHVKEALVGEGFGVLCEIDVTATMKQKLGVAFRPYVILGACNPPLAHAALVAERDIGLLLPCNVIVYSDDVAGRTVVAALDPTEALQLTGNSDVRPLAEDVKARLTRALEAVERSAPASAEP